MNKILIICGPTSTGKTSFALQAAKNLDGELISADSRQVYKTMNIITGKDLPEGVQCQVSSVQWRGKKLCYYSIQGIKVWLYDVVYPNEEFNVSFWHECANLVETDILSRHKLPIIVGGTGLYIKSLLQDLRDISIPPDPLLRNKLSKFTPTELFEYLKNVNLQKANSLNESDRKNPRRLIRAIEISTHPSPLSLIKRGGREGVSYLQIGLSAPVDELDKRIEQRVENRITQGAMEEFAQIRSKYNNSLPSLTASGYRDWDNWTLHEKQYARRQMTWFKKMPGLNWFDITKPDWKLEALRTMKNWYNQS